MKLIIECAINSRKGIRQAKKGSFAYPQEKCSLTPLPTILRDRWPDQLRRGGIVTQIDDIFPLS